MDRLTRPDTGYGDPSFWSTPGEHPQEAAPSARRDRAARGPGPCRSAWRFSACEWSRPPGGWSVGGRLCRDDPQGGRVGSDPRGGRAPSARRHKRNITRPIFVRRRSDQYVVNAVLAGIAKVRTVARRPHSLPATAPIPLDVMQNLAHHTDATSWMAHGLPFAPPVADPDVGDAVPLDERPRGAVGKRLPHE